MRPAPACLPCKPTGAASYHGRSPVEAFRRGFSPGGRSDSGRRVDAWEDGKLLSSSVKGISEDAGRSPVYNLSVSSPHVFLASGFVVHNKGGGGFSSRFGFRIEAEFRLEWQRKRKIEVFFGFFIIFVYGDSGRDPDFFHQEMSGEEARTKISTLSTGRPISAERRTRP